MPVRLNQPLSTSPNADEQAMLANLQGNILKGHGRNRTAHIFVRVKRGKAAQARAFFKKYAAHKVMSAGDQLAAAAIYHREGKQSRSPLVNRAFVTIVFSKSGYKALNIPAASTPANAAFAAGLKARRALVNDPPKNTWHAGYRGELHAMILIGGAADTPASDKSTLVENEIAHLVATAPASAITFVGMERGHGYNNGDGNGIEHFGYVDGRSQPLLLEADVIRERQGEPGTLQWDPAFPLAQVLVKDPAVTDPNAFGAYFVFRKLEQNVKGFKDAEEVLQQKLEALAAAAGKTFPDELAGAMIVGRFEDGTPVELQSSDRLISPVRNNFSFDTDMQGLKCPFSAHIRKANPRGDTNRLFGVPLADERAHIMARRGITYGLRRQKDGAFLDEPTGRVGLLFMAYQADIENQFEFTQASWANNEAFLKSGTGTDPIIGQGGVQPQQHPAGWNDAAAPKHASLFANFVSMRGGEYFFAPSLAFFRSL